MTDRSYTSVHTAQHIHIHMASFQPAFETLFAFAAETVVVLASLVLASASSASSVAAFVAFGSIL